MIKTAVFALALAIAAIAVSEAACYSKCRFRFCNGKTSFKVGVKNDVAFTRAICSKDRKVKVGHVDSTGEARIKLRRGIIRISKWNPSGLKQRFSPSFFKSYNVRGGFSGIGHETPQQNQASFLNKRCFIVPITAYQVLDRDGNVIDNIHPRKPLRDCVAFETRT